MAVTACGTGCSSIETAALPDVATADPDRVRFIALGDQGRANATQRHVARAIRATCQERGCDFGLLLGDNLYDRGMESPDDPRMDEVMAELGRTGVAWYLVHGNHDYAHGHASDRASWAREWADRTDGFHHPAPAYAFDAGPATFHALDTTHAFWHGGSAQLDWLAEGQQASEARWQVVFGHHPFRSNGDHGNAGAYEGWVNVPFSSGAALRELFDEGLCPATDLYLSGHDHSLQLLDRCGATLVVSGSGSAARPLVGRANRARFERAVHGFAWVELGPTAKVLFFDETGDLLHESGAIDPRSVLY